jgi:transcriptional regulator with XRE-family HTH domain
MKTDKFLQVLKSAREAKGMTQEQTAHACGMTLNNYARIERGDTGTTVRTLQKIADTLDLRLVLTAK